MAVVTTNLGTVTAYGDAVAAGYTGTKEQWQALMADYATVGQQASQSAQTASTAATTATTAAQTATTKAGEASASAEAAAESAAAIGTPDTTLTQSGKAADAKVTGDKISEIKEDLNAVFVADSASGSVAHFEDGADGVPMKSVKVALEPIQSGSGDPSPINVRPITGYDSVKVYRSGADTADATEYDISLTSAGTVYGGTLDVVSGVLTIDRAIIDMGDMQWGTVTASGTLLFRSASIASQIATNNDCISSMFAIVKNITELRNTEASFIAKTSNWSSSNLRTAVHDSRYTDANEFKSAVAGQKIVYPLTEPQTIQLTPQQVNSLLGVNNIWSDAGDVDVEYRADTKLYIDKRLGV